MFKNYCNKWNYISCSPTVRKDIRYISLKFSKNPRQRSDKVYRVYINDDRRNGLADCKFHDSWDRALVQGRGTESMTAKMHSFFLKIHRPD